MRLEKDASARTGRCEARPSGMPPGRRRRERGGGPSRRWRPSRPRGTTRTRHGKMPSGQGTPRNFTPPRRLLPGATSQPGKVRSKQLLQELEREKVALLTRLQAQRVALMIQLKHLDEEQQRVLEEFAKQAASVAGKAESGSVLPRPDRLDQILERLERIEGRFQRLEKQQPTAPRQGQR